jgi:hypothetical protein
MVTEQGTILTEHALTKMQRRAIRDEAIEAVMRYGRETHIRGVVIYVIGKKEIAEFLEQGIDLNQYEGIQVVCANDGVVITTYKNKDLKGLHYQKRRGKKHYWK